jgi:hypothetical protein
MKNLFRTMLFLCLTTASVGALSSSLYFDGKVTRIQFYGNGMFLVYTSNIAGAGALSGCTGTKGAFLVPDTHPQRKELLSMFMAAKAMQANVEIKNLTVPSPCWAANFTGDSYFALSGS